MTTIMISDSCTAVIVCLKISCPIFYSYCLPNAETSTPGVSITLTNPSKIVNYLRSRVMPAWLSTMANRSPIRQLNNDDLPELGKPIKATLQTCFSLFYRIVCQAFSLLFFLLWIFYISVCEWRINCFFLLLREKRYWRDRLNLCSFTTLPYDFEANFNSLFRLFIFSIIIINTVYTSKLISVI